MTHRQLRPLTQQTVKKKSAQTEEEKAAARTQRQVAKQERELVERQERERLAAKRLEQLNVVSAAVDVLDRDLEMARRRETTRSDLLDHATGFYEEVEKLGRGKSLMEATPLAVTEANDIVRDAKTLIKGDAYLDRVKEFVPAGNNPTYPDVVITIKTILHALGRAESRFEEATEAIGKRLAEALLLQEALRLYCEGEESVSREELSELTDTSLDKEWFHGYPQEFAFELLDDLDLAAHLANDIEA